jgi:putative CocE/NonD family hydrolase
VSTRTDVLSYETPPLTEAVRIEGAPLADIFARTTGTDGDFVVKLIDVYPPTEPAQPEMGGYELPVGIDIFRGRYRESFTHPSPIPAGKVQEYKFRLPTANYTFKPGHRIMVQVQSTLFPLYDRNPQAWVSNIFFAKPGDFQKATVSIERGSAGASAILLPVVKVSTAQP